LSLGRTVVGGAYTRRLAIANDRASVFVFVHRSNGVCIQIDRGPCNNLPSRSPSLATYQNVIAVCHTVWAYVAIDRLLQIGQFTSK